MLIALLATVVLLLFRMPESGYSQLDKQTSRVRREKALVHSGGIPARKLVRSIR